MRKYIHSRQRQKRVLIAIFVPLLRSHDESFQVCQHQWTLTLAHLQLQLLNERKYFKSKNGMQLPFGPGTSRSTTVPFVVITSWICASTAKPTCLDQPRKSVPLLGVFVITHIIFIVLVDGSKQDQCVRWIAGNGNFRNMDVECVLYPRSQRRMYV